MTPLLFVLLAFVVSVVAGTLGALLGLGGGLLIIPALTLWFHVDIRYAIGASIVSVIATSSGAAVTYVRDRLTNLRVAMVLELATTTGAMTGAYLAGRVGSKMLYIIFGVVMAYSAIMMFRKLGHDESRPARRAPWADWLRLHSSYYDEALSREIPYRVSGTRIGLGLMYVAGIVSGLLGIGSGALKVPAMDLAMGLPLKVSAATSNFMIGVTAAASAGVYFMRGDIDPFVAGPVAVGVLLGAQVGVRLLGRLESRSIRIVFILLLLWVSVQMLLKGRGDENVERAISNVLRIGVLTSIGLILVGILVTFAHHPSYLVTPGDLDRLTHPGAAVPRTVGDVLRDAAALQGHAIVALGLLVLIATPLARVLVSIFAFVAERDRTYGPDHLAGPPPPAPLLALGGILG
jgi:uncharacterized membrane protein YfcA/uncharacterized membrane protein